MSNFQMGSPSIPVLSETGGTVSLESVNVQPSVNLSNATFPSGHIIQSFVIQNGTRSTVSTSGEATLFGDTFTKLRSDTDIFTTCTVFGCDYESGNCGVGMKLNSTWHFGCGYQYDGAWSGTIQTTIIIGTGYWSTPPIGSTTIYFGWKPVNGSTGERPFAIFNPNTTNGEARNQQFISSIVVYEVMPR
tara:strand:- start:1171 stop:1737 length:567 start_codon:yes stop_codon:yes gene_type:complete